MGWERKPLMMRVFGNGVKFGKKIFLFFFWGDLRKRLEASGKPVIGK